MFASLKYQDHSGFKAFQFLNEMPVAKNGLYFCRVELLTYLKIHYSDQPSDSISQSLFLDHHLFIMCFDDFDLDFVNLSY